MDCIFFLAQLNVWICVCVCVCLTVLLQIPIIHKQMSKKKWKKKETQIKKNEGTQPSVLLNELPKILSEGEIIAPPIQTFVHPTNAGVLCVCNQSLLDFLCYQTNTPRSMKLKERFRDFEGSLMPQYRQKNKSKQTKQIAN